MSGIQEEMLFKSKVYLLPTFYEVISFQEQIIVPFLAKTRPCLACIPDGKSVPFWKVFSYQYYSKAMLRITWFNKNVSEYYKIVFLAKQVA